jgi:hypothetical protein
LSCLHGYRKLKAFQKKVSERSNGMDQVGDSMRVADSLKRAVIEINSSESDTLKAQTTPGENAQIKKTHPERYYIIVGTFGNPENVRLFFNRFHKTGNQASKIIRTDIRGKELFMVSIQDFGNSNEAIEFLTEYRSKVDSLAWLYMAK